MERIRLSSTDLLLGRVGDLAVYYLKEHPKSEKVYIIYGKHEGPILATKEELIGLVQLVLNRDLGNTHVS